MVRVVGLIIILFNFVKKIFNRNTYLVEAVPEAVRVHRREAVPVLVLRVRVIPVRDRRPVRAVLLIRGLLRRADVERVLCPKNAAENRRPLLDRVVYTSED